jgi:hypothetical protein
MITPGNWDKNVWINARLVECVDSALDAHVSDRYHFEPLAQDWARISKVIEEVGEAIQELILMTGQNPRKGEHPERHAQLLTELADMAMTGIYALQHFTKDTDRTAQILREAQEKHHGRLCPA